jgi:hypothetical protein
MGKQVNESSHKVEQIEWKITASLNSCLRDFCKSPEQFLAEIDEFQAHSMDKTLKTGGEYQCPAVSVSLIPEPSH